ncbi:MAG TPA: DUF4193 family protein [Acidimicrobiales bacterium]|nr:DUF4193 family protein [Acidimicrobiales bacterium]HLN43427.1 DUF4193 family protein [Acidimicrobiales bacterium]
MRLAERHREPDEAHFTEGELDLEAPEELAVAELDEEAILEEELDNEDLLEQDVDEDTLEVTLEDLVHDGNDEAEESDEEAQGGLGALAVPVRAGSTGNDDPDDVVGADDVEESLDLVLLERMALLEVDGPGAGAGAADLDDEEEGAMTGRTVLLQMRVDTDLVDVAPRGSDEFVCRSCFLVRGRVQLADPATMVCHDCST